jgi:two-component system, NtrC family, response regulator
VGTDALPCRRALTTVAATTVLVVDDERAVRVALDVNLSKAGYIVSLADTAERALDILRTQSVDLVLTDLMMPGIGGMELLTEIREHWPQIQVVLMTGHGTVERAVEAMRMGAHDFVIKPVGKVELLAILDRAIREQHLHRQVDRLQAAADERFGFENIVGTTPAMQSVYDQINAVAQSDAYVLLTGPTGTGKELIGHALHHQSRRKHGPFVQVNCGALPSGLLESELFGHERGAFTGAVRQHKGKFEQADGGTLMLDEIGEMPLDTQVKLLRILESGQFQRVGGTGTIQVDVRVVAATNRDLRTEVREKRFREDLFYRLNVFHIALPSLRERLDDIPLLVDHFVHKYAERHGKNVQQASAKAVAQLRNHPWPGNIRELEHTVERAVILNHGPTIQEFELPDPLQEALPGTSSIAVGEGFNIADALRAHEREMVIAALQAEGGVQARAAKCLGVSRANLNYRIQKLGIVIKEIVYD